MANVSYHNCFLTNKFKKSITSFIEENNVLNNGNTTLLSEKSYDIFSKLGTACSYLEDDDDEIVGTVMGVVTTLNIGKSAYVSFLCFKEDYRGKGHTLPLCENLIKYGTTLHLNSGYFLGTKPRRETSCIVKPFYRILNYKIMKESGFYTIEGKRGKLKYAIKKGATVIEGIDEKIQRIILGESDNNFDLYWKPDPMELRRYTSSMDFFSVYDDELFIGFFILLPIETIIGQTGLKVKMAMLSYCHVVGNYHEKVFRSVIYTANCREYHGLYGYAIGHITEKVIESNGCHIPEKTFYLNIFNHKQDLVPAGINIILF